MRANQGHHCVLMGDFTAPVCRDGAEMLGFRWQSAIKVTTR